MTPLKNTTIESPNTREVSFLGKKVMVRAMKPTPEAIASLGKYRRKRDYFGVIAANPPDIERLIKKRKGDILRHMASMTSIERAEFIRRGPIDFVDDKDKRKKYFITCTRCGEKVAWVWAENDRLDNWCDLHYMTWHDKKYWYGCSAVNVSQVDGKLGFECQCGEDTRDFRTNTSLAPIQRSMMIAYSLKHRDFGTKDSAFIAIEG